MFSDDITSSDVFLDMPPSTQLLYFQLGMNADDDGFISSPKMVMRTINSSADDLKILVTKKFVLNFDNGICVLKHWRINNQIRKDRYTETRYNREKAQLYIRENGTYTFNPEGALPVPPGHFSLPVLFSGNQLATNRQPSIGEVSIVKESEEKVTKPTPLHKTIKYLSNLPEEDVKEWLNRFDVGEKQIRDKAESFKLYCQSKNKKYANYKAALLNAMKSDFKEKTAEQRARRVTRPKLNPDGSPVINPDTGGIVMETV